MTKRPLLPPTRLYYYPDKSMGFGQATRKRGTRRVWDDVQNFLAVCTMPNSPSEIHLTTYLATKWDDDAVANYWIADARQRFGEPNLAMRRDVRDGTVVRREGRDQFEGTSDLLSLWLAYIADNEPWPKQVLGPVTLSVQVMFWWLHPHTREVLDRDGAGRPLPQSHFTLSLGRTQFIQPHFYFPYTVDDPTTEDLLEQVAPNVPIRWLRKHFRTVHPTKNPAMYRFQPIENLRF